MSDPGHICKRCGKPSDKRGYDHCMLQLINALNRVGIKTVEHCCGHGKGLSTLLIDLKSLNSVEILSMGQSGKGVWLTWERKQ